MTVPIKELYSEKAKSAPGPYFPRPDHPVTYSFDQGSPAPETFPYDELIEYARKAIESDPLGVCEYCLGGPDEMTRGYRGLRDRLAERVGRRDNKPALDRDGVMLTNGSSHGLSLIAAAFLGPGDGAVVEASSFPFMVGYMAGTGAKLAMVPVDDDGMAVEQIESRFQEFQRSGIRPKMVYTIPTFHVPTGTVMSLERRRALVELAQKWGVVVV